MTSTPIMGTTGVQMMDAIAPITNSSKSDSLDFKSFMNNAGNSRDEIADKGHVAKDNVQIRDGFKNDSVNDKIKDSEVSTKTENEVTQEVTSDDVEDVKEAIAEVVDKIKEELEVSEEDIIDTLASMGLTAVALLVPENVTKFVVEVTDTEDPILVATDENLMSAINDIEERVNDTIENLCEELNIEPKEFIDALKEYEKAEPVEVTDDVQTTVITTSENSETTENIKPVIKETNSFEDIKVTEKTVAEEETVLDIPREQRKNISTEENISFNDKIEPEKSEEKTEVASFKQESSSDNNREMNNNMLSFTQNLVKETVNALNENSDGMVFTTIDAIDVINQITDSIKTQVTGEVTEVNLKLHPETLGNVSVKISANNEGVLTARFIADNEAVKGIIEAQTISLKETLESKGVTIEAVEVMVGSHEFDENLNRERKNSSSEQTSSRRIRRINIDEVDNLNEEADDEAKLAKEIMEQNGNTIDYTA